MRKTPEEKSANLFGRRNKGKLGTCEVPLLSQESNTRHHCQQEVNNNNVKTTEAENRTARLKRHSLFTYTYYTFPFSIKLGKECSCKWIMASQANNRGKKGTELKKNVHILQWSRHGTKTK